MTRPLEGAPTLVRGTEAAADAAARLLVLLGCAVDRRSGSPSVALAGSIADLPRSDELALWADSGAAALTGHADGPPLAPAAPVATAMAAAATVLEVLSAELGRRVALDGPALLGERAALAGLARRGTVSVGGAARLLPAADGWVAVSLPRDTDWELVPAWVGASAGWSEVTEAVAARPAAELVDRAALLGLAVSPVTDAADASPPAPWQWTGSSGTRPARRPRVVDLSSLWAGPLCAQLLGLAGADVVKVETAERPDGARRGAPAFFDLLHGGHRSVCVDLHRAADVTALVDLLAGADVVIESSRPRALAQLGIRPEQLLAAHRSLTWVSITGHGRSQPTRVGFGDDAAAGGGLLAWSSEPLFCADAVADPVTGLHAAVAATAALLGGGGGLVDLSLAAAAAHVAGKSPRRQAHAAEPRGRGWTFGGARVAAPRARPVTGSAPPIGAHTDEVLGALRPAR